MGLSHPINRRPDNAQGSSTEGRGEGKGGIGWACGKGREKEIARISFLD